MAKATITREPIPQPKETVTVHLELTEEEALAVRSLAKCCGRESDRGLGEIMAGIWHCLMNEDIGLNNVTRYQKQILNGYLNIERLK